MFTTYFQWRNGIFILNNKQYLYNWKYKQNQEITYLENKKLCEQSKSTE